MTDTRLVLACLFWCIEASALFLIVVGQPAEDVGFSPPRSCGTGSLDPSNRRQDGTLTGPCDWPFLVSIRSLSSQSVEDLTYDTTSHVCQGVLIDDVWVLTSSVCAISAGGSQPWSRMLVVAADYNIAGRELDPLTQSPQEQLIRVTSFHLHPDYPLTSLEQILASNNTRALNSHAVALIKLAEPINGRCSGPVCLPTPQEVFDDCATYQECVITGWGFTLNRSTDADVSDEMLLGRVNLPSRTACNFLAKRWGVLDRRPLGTRCLGTRDWGTDLCMGEAGGPVMCSNGYNWVLRGIVPYHDCRDPTLSHFITDPALYLGWIRSVFASQDPGAT